MNSRVASLLVVTFILAPWAARADSALYQACYTAAATAAEQRFRTLGPEKALHVANQTLAEHRVVLDNLRRGIFGEAKTQLQVLSLQGGKNFDELLEHSEGDLYKTLRAFRENIQKEGRSVEIHMGSRAEVEVTICKKDSYDEGNYCRFYYGDRYDPGNYIDAFYFYKPMENGCWWDLATLQISQCSTIGMGGVDADGKFVDGVSVRGFNLDSAIREDVQDRGCDNGTCHYEVSSKLISGVDIGKYRAPEQYGRATAEESCKQFKDPVGTQAQADGTSNPHGAHEIIPKIVTMSEALSGH
ncbi:MAG TPA: hypothetical protein VL588_08745 [Bdellovibrionota bacterium]|jgi:hypothetical protein|nr:hypothetical protein [Bdellovibrionota bacterium]